MTLIVVDSKKYAKSNCFISQLIDSLKEQAHLSGKKLFLIELSKLQKRQSKKVMNVGQNGTILICRQRILNQFLKSHGSSNPLSGLPISIYEQDPWQAYIRGSQSLGFFEELGKKLNVQNIFITSRWWSEFVGRQEGLSTSFVHMWMSPKYCSEGVNIKQRHIKIGFKGTLHKHRLQFFANLSNLGVHVQIDTETLRYRDYLKWLSSVGIFAHDESKYFPTIFGDIPMSTGLWVKDIEVASRGCFTVRNAFESESDSYFIEKIPSIFLFQKVDEVPELIKQISEMSEDEVQKITQESVKYIEQANLWVRTANRLLDPS